MKKLFLTSIVVLFWVAAVFAQKESKFLAKLEVSEEELKNKSKLELICGQYAQEKLKPMIKQEYEGRAYNIMIIGAENGIFIHFTVKTPKFYNEDKLCQKIQTDLKEYCEQEGVNVLKTSCTKAP